MRFGGIFRLISAVSLLTISILPLPAIAADPGETGELLDFGAGGRALGMGSAYTSLAQDSTATYWNPAGLAALRRNDIDFLHASLYGGATYDYLSYGGLRLGQGVMGAQVARLGISGADLRDENNHLMGSFGYSETDLGLGYGMVLPQLPTLGLGVSGNLLNRSLYNSSDHMMGFSFAGQYAATHNVGVGLAFKNALRFSQGDTSDKLAQQIRLGANYRPLQGLTLATDLQNFSQFSLGAEYVWNVVAIRAGLTQSNPTFGLGLHIKDVRVDFAMASNTDLGASERISAGFTFGKPKGSETDFNPVLSTAKFLQQGEDAITKGYYSQAEQLYRDARHVNPSDHDIQDRIEHLSMITPYLHSVAGWDRPSKMARQGINTYIAGKYIDGLWLMTYSYSLDKGQSGLLRAIQSISKATGYQVDLYDSSSPLTLTQQILAQSLNDFRAQHYDQAVSLCDRVISLEPNNSLAYKRLGSSLYALHQFDAAKTAWQKALAYEPNAPAKEELKRFIEMARSASLGLPVSLPGNDQEPEDDADLENVMTIQ